MSNANNNIVTRKNKGAFGKQVVFRQRGGDTIMCNHPGPRTGEPTPDQLAVRERFNTAIRYARAAIANEALKAAYQAVAPENRSAYNMAVADAFKAPEIRSIDSSQYTGLPNSTIRIDAMDDFRVESVYVQLLNQAGDILEEGPAVTDPNSQYWIYTAISNNPAVAGSTVRAKATDLPGNAVTKDFLL
ncbi:hypothetical protein AAHN97_16125 [Chitinophaga niabensis]|uniref:hypothetical protein n=1 Tax=Chitinophaga niabensis TaxID=536979 RepID=UPI0031BB54C9